MLTHRSPAVAAELAAVRDAIASVRGVLTGLEERLARLEAQC